MAINKFRTAVNNALDGQPIEPDQAHVDQLLSEISLDNPEEALGVIDTINETLGTPDDVLYENLVVARRIADRIIQDANQRIGDLDTKINAVSDDVATIQGGIRASAVTVFDHIGSAFKGKGKANKLVRRATLEQNLSGKTTERTSLDQQKTALTTLLKTVRERMEMLQNRINELVLDTALSRRPDVKEAKERIKAQSEAVDKVIDAGQDLLRSIQKAIVQTDAASLSEFLDIFSRSLVASIQSILEKAGLEAHVKALNARIGEFKSALGKLEGVRGSIQEIKGVGMASEYVDLGIDLFTNAPVDAVSIFNFGGLGVAKRKLITLRGEVQAVVEQAMVLLRKDREFIAQTVKGVKSNLGLEN